MTAGPSDEEATLSPVGHWRLDRDNIELGLDDDRGRLLASLLVPDMDLRILDGGRFGTLVPVGDAEALGRPSQR